MISISNNDTLETFSSLTVDRFSYLKLNFWYLLISYITIQESNGEPQQSEMSLQEGLQQFDSFLKNVTEAVGENEHLPNRKFKNTIAGMLRTIPIFLQSEGEEYGMTIEIYNSLMAYKKAKSARFQSMMTLGNFSLEGSNSYSEGKVVICIPDIKSTLHSFVPLYFMETIAPPEVKTIVGVNRKFGERGPGRKNFTLARTAVVVSQNLTINLSDVIEEYLKPNTNVSNKRKIVEASIKSISKSF